MENDCVDFEYSVKTRTCRDEQLSMERLIAVNPITRILPSAISHFIRRGPTDPRGVHSSVDINSSDIIANGKGNIIDSLCLSTVSLQSTLPRGHNYAQTFNFTSNQAFLSSLVAIVIITIIVLVFHFNRHENSLSHKII